jgi:hypothetical protein
MTGERRSGTHSGVGRPHDGAHVEENAILPENLVFSQSALGPVDQVLPNELVIEGMRQG